MGLLFYYLFHYLRPPHLLLLLADTSPSLPLPLPPGIEGKHKSAAASLLCALVYTAVICSSSGGGGGGDVALVGSATRTRMWPLCGGFTCCFVRCGNCETPAGLHCGVTQRMPRFKKCPAVGTIVATVPESCFCLYSFFLPPLLLPHSPVSTSVSKYGHPDWRCEKPSHSQRRLPP